MLIHNLVATGSLSYNGVNISYVTGSQTSLDGLNQFSASVNTTTGSLNSTTSSLNTATGSLFTASGSFSTRVTTIESKYATTGSNIFTGAQTVCANITSTGTIIAQTLNVQQVTSSIVYSSGSNIFGCQLTDTQQMTGSLRVTGSNALFNVGCVGIGNISPAANLHVLTPSTGTGVIFRYTGGTNNPGLFVSTEESTKYVRLTASGTSVAGQLLQLGAEGTAGVVNVGVANVGIGTPTNLNQRLTIVDSNDAEALGVYRCFSAASDAGTYFRLGALNGSGVPTAGAAIFGALESAKTSGYLSFFTYCGSTACERMRITSAGNVGIGTTSPGSRLESKAPGTGATTNYASKNIIANSPLIGGYTGGPIVSMLAMYDGSIHGADIGYLYDSIGYGLAFSVNNDTSGDPIERMRITSCGLLTINDTTTSTNYKFAVKGASFLAGTNNKGVYITDTSTYASIVGLNKEISAYNPIELRASGTDYQLYLTTNGNVGIGTGNPIEKFEVCGHWGNIRTYGRSGVRLNNISNNLYYNGSVWVRDNGSYGAQGITFDTDGDLIFETTAATSGDTSPRMTIAGGGDISITCNVSISGNITLNTGANRILRLGSASAYYYDLQSVGDNFEIKEAGTTTRMKIFYPSGITCFSSTICAPCFATISDYRMKSNIRPIEGLSIIMNTKPYKFDYNYDCAPSFGMIAHELQEIVPEAVFGVKDGEVMQGVDYMKLLPIAIKAIQEQQCKINILESCLGIN